MCCSRIVGLLSVNLPKVACKVKLSKLSSDSISRAQEWSFERITEIFDREWSAKETGLNRGEGRSEPIGDRLEDRLHFGSFSSLRKKYCGAE